MNCEKDLALSKSLLVLLDDNKGDGNRSVTIRTSKLAREVKLEDEEEQ